MNWRRIVSLTLKVLCAITFSFIYVFALTSGKGVSLNNRLWLSANMCFMWYMIFWLGGAMLEYKDKFMERTAERMALQRKIQEMEARTDKDVEELNEMMREVVLSRHEAAYWKDHFESLLEQMHEDEVVDDPTEFIENERLQCSVFLGEVSESLRNHMESVAEDRDPEEREAIQQAVRKLYDRRKS
jgi:hypothetical protein